MKLNSPSLALFFLSAGVPTAYGLCIKDHLLSIDYMMEDPTLGFEDGIICSLAKVKRVFKKLRKNLTGCGKLNQEVRDVFGTARGNEINAILKGACDAAAEPDHSATSDFRDIFDFDYNTDDGEISNDEAEDRFLKEFYDGNTFLNQEVGNYAALSTRQNQAFSKISEFDQFVSEKQVVDWPSEDVDNFDSCQMNTAMCCWVTDRVINNDGNGNCAGPYPNANGPEGSNCIDADPADNTDICYVDNERSPQANHVDGGFILYPDDVEGDTHCHGFVWADDDDHVSSIYKGNNLFYVSMEDHLRSRGYVRNVPGAPMCGCLEQMPTVSRADCTQTSHKYKYDFRYSLDENNNPVFEASVKSREVYFNQCDGETNNDLASKYEQMVQNGHIQESEDFDDIIVGEDNCAEKMEGFLEDKGFTKV